MKLAQANDSPDLHDLFPPWLMCNTEIKASDVTDSGKTAFNFPLHGNISEYQLSSHP